MSNLRQHKPFVHRFPIDAAHKERHSSLHFRAKNAEKDGQGYSISALEWNCVHEGWPEQATNWNRAGFQFKAAGG